MLSLKKEIDFREVLRRGKSQQTRFFTLKYLRREDDLFCRVGIIASKKISKLATKRNRARRRLKEAISAKIKSFKGIDMVFLVKKELLDAHYKDIQTEAVGLLQALK